MIRAALFDMDGVLYDSMPSHVRAWSETASAHGLVYDPDNFYLWEGRTAGSTVGLLFNDTFGRDATEEEVRSIYAEKAALFSTFNTGRTVDGATEVVRRARKLGLDTLIVTGSGQRCLLDRLDADYPSCFSRERMVTGFDVRFGKPHPEPYLMGLEKAGVQATDAIVIENAPLGVQSARAAGIYVAAVNTGPLPDSVLYDAGANIVYPDMGSLATDLVRLIVDMDAIR